MVTASACTALLVLVIIMPLAIIFGATGAVGGGLFTGLAAVFAGKSFRRRRRDGGAS